MLEPDGQLSHWLKVSKALREVVSARIGGMVTVQVSPVDRKPEPKWPEDLQQTLSTCPAATAVWESTTTIALLDWSTG